MDWEVLRNIFQLTVSGLAVGSIYSLVALGFVIIYKATDVFNFAQGELMILGAFICYFFIVQLHIPIFWAFLLTFFSTAIIGLVTEELFLRPMVGEPIFAVIMVTIGLSVFLKGIIGFSWGYMIKKFPTFVSEAPVSFSGFVISPAHLVTIIVAGVLIAIFAIILASLTIIPEVSRRTFGFSQTVSLYLRFKNIVVTKMLLLNLSKILTSWFYAENKLFRLKLRRKNNSAAQAGHTMETLPILQPQARTRQQ